MTESRAADAFEELTSFLEANDKGHWIRKGTPTHDAPHPLWAHLVPSSLRAFVARCGYPSILAPKLRIAFVPLHLQPTIGLAEPGFDWHLYKALLQTAVRRANGAFFGRTASIALLLPPLFSPTKTVKSFWSSISP